MSSRLNLKLGLLQVQLQTCPVHQSDRTQVLLRLRTAKDDSQGHLAHQTLVERCHLLLELRNRRRVARTHQSEQPEELVCQQIPCLPMMASLLRETMIVQKQALHLHRILSKLQAWEKQKLKGLQRE